MDNKDKERLKTMGKRWREGYQVLNALYELVWDGAIRGIITVDDAQEIYDTFCIGADGYVNDTSFRVQVLKIKQVIKDALAAKAEAKKNDHY